MPGFLTHWYILIETARRSQDATSGLQSLIMDATALRRRSQGWVSPPETPPAGAVWNTDPLPEMEFRYPGSDLSSMAFLGALTPDFMLDQHSYFRKKSDRSSASNHDFAMNGHKSIPWSEMLHRKRSGNLVLTYLELITHIPSPALRSQALAFALGYLSHIATDLAFNPWINALAASYSYQIPGATNAAIELRLDEYIAEHFFNRPLYEGLQQPWQQYIAPALQSLNDQDSLTIPILHQLAAAVETTYALSEEQAKLFLKTYRENIQKWRYHLAGWRSPFIPVGLLQPSAKRSKQDPLTNAINATNTHKKEVTSVEDIYAYALRLSEHFCRLAISYYAAMRKPETGAATRSQLRVSLARDLRNWDLDTGYAIEIETEEEITLRFQHNWVHFARLWQPNPDTAY